MTRLRQALARFLFALGRRVNVPCEYTYTVELTADATAFVEGMTRAAAATARFGVPRVDEITDGVPLVEFLDRGPQ